MYLEYQRDPDEPLMELPEIANEKEQLQEKIKHRSPIEDDISQKAGGSRENKGVGNFSERSDSGYLESSKKENTNIQNELKKFENRNIVKEMRSKVEKIPFQNKFEHPEVEKVIKETFNGNTSPANKDFDYIKARHVNVKPKYVVDPVAELRNLPRKSNTDTDDEPPYNFQAILRKTNIRRDSTDSLRNALQAVRRFSISKSSDSTNELMRNGLCEEEPVESKLISMELAPGVFVEGHEVEL